MLRWLYDCVKPPCSLGEAGERVAARFLKDHRYRILERNLREGKDEADVVALAPDRRTVVIVEVKTRRDDSVTPEEQVSIKKMRRLTRLAQRLQQRDLYRDCPFRFDVIAIVWPHKGKPKIRHHESAFTAVE